eukprot:11377214-Alexandrium_andersonii.AAC.1
MAHDNTVEANQKMRLAARKAFLEADAHRKLAVQALHNERRSDHFDAGDLVFFWRRGKGRRQRPGARGSWYGPAQVISHERR